MWKEQRNFVFRPLLIVMQKNNSVAEVEYIDKSENAPPIDGIE